MELRINGWPNLIRFSNMIIVAFIFGRIVRFTYIIYYISINKRVILCKSGITKTRIFFSRNICEGSFAVGQDFGCLTITLIPFFSGRRIISNFRLCTNDGKWKYVTLVYNKYAYNKITLKTKKRSKDVERDVKYVINNILKLNER